MLFRRTVKVFCKRVARNISGKFLVQNFVPRDLKVSLEHKNIYVLERILTVGVFLFHRNLKIGYFSQHHVDQLGSELTPLALLASKFPGTEENRS